MLFLFGSSLPQSLSRYFTDRAQQDGHRNIFASMGTFASSEAFSQPRDVDLKGQPIVVFQSFAEVGKYSANDYFTKMLFVGATLKRYGAGPLWAVVPFGPYARQDQERDGKMDSLGCDIAAEHIALHYEGLSTIEIHSEKALKLLENRLGKGNVFTIDPTDLYVEDLANFKIQSPVIVSPDKGANARADALAKSLDADRFYVDKERSEIVNTRIIGSHGDVQGRDAILVDDMVDTFGTASNSACLVRKKGAARVFFYAAHPVNSAPAWDRLAKLIDRDVIDHVGLGNTIARGAEFETFAQQYGPHIADKVTFLATEKPLYKHVTQEIAHHPAMQTGRG